MLKKGTAFILSFFFSCAALAAEYWIDVRVPQQYQRQHVEGAINIPLAELDRRIGLEVANKDDTVHLYCNSGRQSAEAKKILDRLGYTNAIDEGGLNNLVNK